MHRLRCSALLRHRVGRGSGGFTLGPLDLDLRPGVTCLLGPNGAGKSTLFALAAGLDRPTSGTLQVTGGLGYLPQDPVMPGAATARDLLHHVAWLHRVPRRRRAECVTQALLDVDLLDRADARLRTLSGGMLRRVGIATALVHRPGVVLLDEPTVGLDPQQRLQVRDTVRRLAPERVVLLSTHLVEDVRAVADRVLVLSHGVLRHDGSVDGLARLAAPGAPGDSDLERGLATVLARAERPLALLAGRAS